MMWRRLLILDLVLLLGLVAGILRVRGSWKDFEASHRVETVRPEAEADPTIPGAATLTATPEDWTEISVKDPFSFDRSDIAIVTPRQVPPTQPKPVLFGTMSIGNERIAMLAPGQSGTRTSRPIKVGESLDDWQVVEILDKSVVVTAANGLRETIIMNDPKERVARVSDRTGNGSTAAPANVITASPPPTPPGTANSPVPSQPSAQPGQAGQPADDILQTPFGPVKRTRP